MTNAEVLRGVGTDRYVGKGKKSYGNEKISWRKVTIKIGPLT